MKGQFSSASEQVITAAKSWRGLTGSSCVLEKHYDGFITGATLDINGGVYNM